MMSERVPSIMMIDAGVTIGIVDDDPGVRTALEQLLRSGEYNAVAFQSAEEFLEHADVGKIACLVVDVNLPGMNGVELLNRLSTRETRVPAVLITGRDDAATERLLNQAEGIRKLRKPFSSADLFETIMMVMHS